MLNSRGRKTPGRSDNSDGYRQAFIAHVHRLVKMGYNGLDHEACGNAEEETITGYLVASIADALDKRSAPAWARWYNVHEDPPVAEAGRTGRRRRRVDIKFESAELRPRQRFSFESKRLSHRHSVSTYLGKDGLGCFLSGAYAAGDNAAGMLGYVQSGETEDWAEKIKRALTKSPRKYAIRSSGAWRETTLDCGPAPTCRTRHDRKRGLGPIEVFHTLLLCH